MNIHFLKIFIHIFKKFTYDISETAKNAENFKEANLWEQIKTTHLFSNV